MPATSRPRRTPCPFGFTIRLTETQRIHFESLAQAQGHTSIAATFKAQALACGMEHPLQEMRLSVDYMTSRMTDESAGLDQHVDAKERMQCKQELEVASRAYNQCRSELRSIEKSMALLPDQGMADGAAHLLKHAQVPARSRLDAAAASLARAEHALRIARQKSLRLGTDLVFSAPKSVSMQWAAQAATGDVAGPQVIEQAHGCGDAEHDTEKQLALG